MELLAISIENVTFAENIHDFQMKRINWIDWVKAFCMTVVVFCHLPQQEDTFYLQYLASVILSSFFFVSGYLKKKILSPKESLKKYSYSLLIPYLIYNIIYYPYWLAKFYIEHGSISMTDSLKPIIGTLLLQFNSDFSCELNGVTWFLPALFLMHWITDICHRHHCGKAIMLILTVISIILYGANKYHHFAPYITFHGFVRSIGFFFMGYLFRQKNIMTDVFFRKDLAIGLVTLAISILLFYWHIHEERFVLHIALFYVVNLLSVYGIIYLCRSIDSLHIRIITFISIGTMLIFGIHRIIIGTIDYGFEKFLNTSDILYSWYECTLLALFIELLSLPLILLVIHHYPILLGKKKQNI
jgi:hypothetical protein